MTHSDYLRWLRAAYLYYIIPGEPTGMTDGEWDATSKAFYENRDAYPERMFPVIHREEFTGGSLFWLKRDEYPFTLAMTNWRK